MSMSKSPCDKWLAEARAGSREALGKVLQAFGAYLHRLATRRLGSDLRVKGSPADLVQETFLEAQRDFGCFQGKTIGKLRVWLRQMLLHNLANFQREYRGTGKRRLSREESLSSWENRLAAAGSSPSQQVMGREEAEILEAALKRLREEDRRLILLRHKDQRTFKAIGQAMGRSTSGARFLCVRALARLNEIVREMLASSLADAPKKV